MDNTYDALRWGSHLPALLGCIGSTVGPVLEIGIGHFSTPALHALCVSQSRFLVSVESDAVWSAQFAHLNIPHHLFFQNIDDIPEWPWSVVFIDDSPGGQHRADLFRKFIRLSSLVVVHDYHHENEAAIKPLLSGVWHCVTRRYEPPTLIASDCRSLPAAALFAAE